MQLLCIMPHRVQSSSNDSISEDDNSNVNALCINSTQVAANGSKDTAFMPLAPVVGTDDASYESFDAYIACMPPKNCHVVPDERFKRFVRVLRARTYQVTILHSWKGTVRSCSTQRSLDRKHRMARASRSVPGYSISVFICALASAYNGRSVKTHTRVGSKR